MRNELSQLPENKSIQARNSFWSIIVLLVDDTFQELAAFRQAISTGHWQAWADFSVVALFFLIILVCLFLNQRGRSQQAIYLLIGSFLFTIVARNAFTAGLGIFYGLVAGGITAVLAFFNFPGKTAIRITIVSILIGGLLVLFDYIVPPYRQAAPPALLGSLPIIGALVVGLLLFLLVRQAWGGNIRLKLITAFTFIALLSVGVLATVTYINFRNQIREDIRQRLFNIVSLVAMNQNGDLHATIRGPEDAQAQSHLSILAQNVAYLATDPDLKYIYTMRKNDQGQIYFVINARQGGEPGDPIGTIYNEPSDLLRTQFDTMTGPVVEKDLYTDVYGQVLASYAPFYRSDGTREGIIGVDIAAEKVLAAERSVFNLILVTTVITMILVTMIGLWLGNLFVGPIINLSSVAKQITQGNLSARAAIETTDEVGELAQSFNTMTAQLQETLLGLEQRVADRTRNLELAAQVGRSVSQVRALDVMLEDAAEIIRANFNLYYVQVYLIDSARTKLVLEAGTGAVGSELLARQHSLPLNINSINGRAAIEKRSVVISNTSASPTFKANPLLPETRSEMAVPLLIGDEVVGVLDMQSSKAGTLTEEVLPAFEALAGQLAIAIQNANLLTEAEQARAEVEKQAARLVRAAWTEHLDAIHKPEHLGFVFTGDQVIPQTEPEQPEAETSQNALAVPIAISSEQIGELIVEIDDTAQASQVEQLVSAVARQVAQQLENLRLLESAERYREESEQVIRRQTVEGWQEYIASRNAQRLGYFYDLHEIQPASGEVELPAEEPVVTLPVKVREEAIGKVAIAGLDPNDNERLSLANEIVSRLSAHIENLRQLEETKRGQIELNKRARQLAAVAEVSTVSSRELDIQKLLETVVFLTQRRFGLYHAHVFVYNEHSTELTIAACGWKEGDEHEGTHGTTTILLEQEQSIVARAARTRQAVIVNDVRNEPGWLPNPLLPDTRAEVAVPLVIGEQLLGVLDVQSDHLDAFSQEDANIYATLASQVATALQNARSFAQAQQQAQREAMLNAISQKIQSATSVEAVLQIAARELGHALGAPRTIAQLSLKDKK